MTKQRREGKIMGDLYSRIHGKANALAMKKQAAIEEASKGPDGVVTEHGRNLGALHYRTVYQAEFNRLVCEEIEARPKRILGVTK